MWTSPSSDDCESLTVLTAWNEKVGRRIRPIRSDLDANGEGMTAGDLDSKRMGNPRAAGGRRLPHVRGARVGKRTERTLTPGSAPSSSPVDIPPPAFLLTKPSRKSATSWIRSETRVRSAGTEIAELARRARCAAASASGSSILRLPGPRALRTSAASSARKPRSLRGADWPCARAVRERRSSDPRASPGCFK
jgi:hypothetical protein